MDPRLGLNELNLEIFASLFERTSKFLSRNSNEF